MVSASITEEKFGSDAMIDVNVSGGTAPYSFEWSNGASTEDLTNIPGGYYALTITDANFCTQLTFFDARLVFFVGLFAFHAHAGHGMAHFHAQPGLHGGSAIAIFIAGGCHFP